MSRLVLVMVSIALVVGVIAFLSFRSREVSLHPARPNPPPSAPPQPGPAGLRERQPGSVTDSGKPPSHPPAKDRESLSRFGPVRQKCRAALLRYQELCRDDPSGILGLPALECAGGTVLRLWALAYPE